MNRDSGVLTRLMVWDFPSGETEGANQRLFQMCLPSMLCYISVARRAMDALGDQLSLSADDCSALKLAVGEACNNVVQHGNFREGLAEENDRRNDNRKIFVTCRLFPEAIEIDVISEEVGFRPSPGHRVMPAAESMAESGRGLALIELMMDSVEYLTLNGNHVVRMRKRLNSPSFD